MTGHKFLPDFRKSATFFGKKKTEWFGFCFLATIGLLTLSAMMNPLPSLAYFTVLWTSHATIFNLTILITKFGENRRGHWRRHNQKIARHYFQNKVTEVELLLRYSPVGYPSALPGLGVFYVSAN
jgi:hypothetical protein